MFLFFPLFLIESKSKSESSSLSTAASGEIAVSAEIARLLGVAASSGADVVAELAKITRAALSVALCNAAEECNIAAIDALVLAGADMRGDVDAGLDAPLAIAAGVRYGDNVVGVMRRLIALGASVDGEGLERYSPLARALVCRSASNERVQLLLDAGADPLRRDSLGRTVLHFCAANKQLEWFTRFVGMGVDVRACANDGTSVMHVAAGSRYCDVDAVRAIGGFGPDLLAVDAHGESALLKAISKDRFDVSVAAALVELGVDIRVVDAVGENALHRVMRHAAVVPLHFAMRRSAEAMELVRALVARGLDVNCRTADGNTPLLLLVQRIAYLSDELMDVLFELGADPAAINSAGQSTFAIAALEGPDGALAKLVKLGANVNQPLDANGASVLHLCLARKAKKLKELVALGADVNGVDKRGATPLHYACARDFSDAIHTLIECGANRYAATSFGEQPIACAVRNGQSEAIRALARAGVDIGGVCTRAGDTPLTLAVRANKIPVVETLHRLGVAMGAANVHGELPLVLAARSGDATMIRLLVELGAKVSQQVPRGESPLVIAVRFAHDDAAKALVELGADVAEAARALDQSVEVLNDILQRNLQYSARCFREAPVRDGCTALAPSQSIDEPLSTLLLAPYLRDWFLEWLLLPDLYALALVNRAACRAVQLHWSESNRRRYLVAEATLRALCPTRVAERRLLCRAMNLSRGHWLVVETGECDSISGSLQSRLVDVFCSPHPLTNCVADVFESNEEFAAEFCTKCGTDSPDYATRRWGVCRVCVQTRPLMWLRWCRTVDYGYSRGNYYDILDVSVDVDESTSTIADAVRDASADEPTLLTARALLDQPLSSRFAVGLPYHSADGFLGYTFVALLSPTDAAALRAEAAQLQACRKTKRKRGASKEMDGDDDDDDNA